VSLTSFGPAVFQNLFIPRGARYLFLSVIGEIYLEDVKLAEVLSPSPEEKNLGSFITDDLMWNRIIGAARETIRYARTDVTASDSFREFCAWLGDTHWIGLNLYYSFFDPAFIGYTWELYARNVDDAGRMGSVVPGYFFFHLPVWTWLYWQGIWTHFLYTGDVEFLKRTFPACLKTYEYFEKLKSPNGLLNNIDGWSIVDWSKIDFEGESFVLNALYRRSLISLSRSAAALGLDHSTFDRQIEQIKKSLSDSRFYDSKQKLFYDGIKNGLPVKTISQHAQILAYDLGLWDDAVQGDLCERLYDSTLEMWTLGESSFHWAADILKTHPSVSGFYRFIYNLYSYKIECGDTCFGHRHPGSKPGAFNEPVRSPCHGWATAPLYLSGALALGVVPTAPGYSKLLIAPRSLIEGMTKADGQVPTPHGPIHVKWKLPSKSDGGYLRLSLPPNVETTIDLQFILGRNNLFQKIEGAETLSPGLFLATEKIVSVEF
jgi:hypothetical protein